MKKAVSEGEFIGSGSIKKSPWIPNLYLHSSTDESSNHLNLVLASSSNAFTRYSLHLVCGTELPCRLLARAESRGRICFPPALMLSVYTWKALLGMELAD